ncbi:unnamed protein product [Timema podura]|uniref:Uncharacterized protein n=1 Tax=Timema podura TaxID=61482 RepID=A0ABN7NV05_TIMPD|nr:unnamed protein product [Timema podura]
MLPRQSGIAGTELDKEEEEKKEGDENMKPATEIVEHKLEPIELDKKQTEEPVNKEERGITIDVKEENKEGINTGPVSSPGFVMFSSHLGYFNTSQVTEHISQCRQLQARHYT